MPPSRQLARFFCASLREDLPMLVVGARRFAGWLLLLASLYGCCPCLPVSDGLWLVVQQCFAVPYAEQLILCRVLVCERCGSGKSMPNAGWQLYKLMPSWKCLTLGTRPCQILRQLHGIRAANCC